MIRAMRQSSGLLRHVWLTMATLAIALKIIIPPGFMAGAPTNDLPFALVLCTTQGAMVVDSGGALPTHEDGKGTSDAAKDAPCLFAGLAMAEPPPALTDMGAVEFVAYDYRPQAVTPDVTPGRGRPAPPLPARGPPTQLI